MKPSSSTSSRLALFHSQGSGSSSAGCILGALRRILCFDLTLPSTSSCYAAEAEDDDDKMRKVVDNKAAAVPSLVARLMGLDSIPERRITRSRSLNSVVRIKPQEDDQERKVHLHRRSQSSLPFRETPTCIELDDDEFIVLKFDTPKKSPKINQNRRTSDKTRSAATKKDEHTQSKACQVGSFQQVAKQQPSEIENCNQRLGNSRLKKQIRLVKKNHDSDTEESSPVSIFDFQEPTSASACDDSWTRCSSSGSGTSSPEPDSTKISAEQDDRHNAEEAVVESRSKAALLNNNTVVAVNSQKKNKEMWGRFCDITVAEVKGAADWCVKDLAAEFEGHIMDQLLNDLLLLLRSI